MNVLVYDFTFTFAGGNLGLFSGLSFLGLFELLFWMAKLLASTFNENRSSKEWKTRKTRGHLKE